jgi:acid phosphatase type 7
MKSLRKNFAGRSLGMLQQVALVAAIAVAVGTKGGISLAGGSSAAWTGGPSGSSYWGAGPSTGGFLTSDVLAGGSSAAWMGDSAKAPRWRRHEWRLSAAAGLVVPPGEIPQLKITHGPYLQLPGTTTMTVVWHTDRPAVSYVEYGTTEALGSTAIAAEHGLRPNDRTSHVIRLDGLAPGTIYHYRIVSREFEGYEKQHIVGFGGTVSGDVYSFRTFSAHAGSGGCAGLVQDADGGMVRSGNRGGSAENVAGGSVEGVGGRGVGNAGGSKVQDAGRDYSFAVVSDIHEQAKRLDAMMATLDWKRTAFVVFNGDMVNDFMDAAQPFSGFVDVSVERFARRVPFVYVRGNHDVRGRFARRLADYFPTDRGRAYYSFDHGPAHFIVLDSGEDKVDTHEYYNGLVAFEPYRREQAEWLDRDLLSDAAGRARFRIVFSHIPPRGGDGFAIQQVRELWEGAANRGNVDLWLSGHMHRIVRLDPAEGGNGYHLVVGAQNTITLVDVSRDRLSVVVRREDGEKLDEIVIEPRR